MYLQGEEPTEIKNFKSSLVKKGAANFLAK